MAPQAILFTNIDGISIGDVHAHAHALLLADKRARGFLYNSVTPTFAVQLASLEYQVKPVECAGTPLRGIDLVVSTPSSHLELRVNLTNGNDDPINITAFDRDRSYEEIWNVMNRRIVAYWTAPYFLESRQVSIHDARQHVGIRRS